MNRTDRPIYYFVVERESAALMDWVPCTNVETCPAAAPGAQTLLSFDRIVGYDVIDPFGNTIFVMGPVK